MFYWLADFSGHFGFLNVFRYITFRTGGAIVTALVFVFLFGGPMIDLLRIKQGKGQPIRSDGPQSHLIDQEGHAHHGRPDDPVGPAGVDLAVGQSRPTPMSGSCCCVTLSFGLIGFYDDYLKVTKRNPTRRLPAARA